jgi:hypothetical protein
MATELGGRFCFLEGRRMAEYQSETIIANKALILLGNTQRIASLNDSGELAKNLQELWVMARVSLIASHTWNFAIKREKLLAEVDVKPEFGYAYCFKKPEGMLRWLPWAKGEPYWFAGEEEGEYLVADEAAIYVRYLVDIAEIGKWPPLFCESMAYQLAVEYCEAKSGQKGLADRLMGDLDRKLGRPMSAKLADGLASGKRDRGNILVNSRWASARHLPTGVSSR